MTEILTLARKEITDLRRNRFMVVLFAFLAVAVVLSVIVASADFRLKIADYQHYVDALKAAGSSATAPEPSLFPLQMLRGGIEYLEIIGSLFAVVLGYSMITKEKGRGTLALLFSRPLGRYAFIGGKILAVVLLWVSTVAALFLVITASLLVIGNAPLHGGDYVHLFFAAAHTAVYLIMWSLLAMSLASLIRRTGTGLVLALVLWLVVVLIIPQIGDTMDPDNQIPGGLFASLQVDKSHEQAVMAHFTGYETTRDLIEQTSVTKQYERATFAYLGIKNEYNQQPLSFIWAGTFNNTLWLLAALAASVSTAMLSGTKKIILRKVS
ncbi:ABC transporter permease [Arthrobacter cryoconiti]|uniref:ABC transporter permease n=1 Tax=Arthrobacter cryoconiti TaxID=748907 RepID=A0ABV8R3J1_9MICC|nr:ABC transporter permease subunit [Arthrobacter cryoconiti]MCC9069886.1 ABC transporter permease [Arthrobacter cryoconiti]